MYRKLLQNLIRWKESRNRKPLIIRGARQVGKTCLMKEFGKEAYQKTAYFYYEDNPVLKDVFEKPFDLQRILTSLQAEAGFKITPDETLLIFDEIQEIPRALTALKYFYEQAPEYNIVCAGSLLGIALHKGTSFPVGKVNFMDLYPLSFTEFVQAVRNEELAALVDGTTKDSEIINSFSSVFLLTRCRATFRASSSKRKNDSSKQQPFYGI